MRLHVEIARVYDEARHGTGYRVLVDRLWPRGVSKSRADLDEWAKDVAPSTELRRWYGHDVDRFEEFARRYREELKLPDGSAGLRRLSGVASRRRLILVTATSDVEHSGAWVLAATLRRRRAASSSR